MKHTFKFAIMIILGFFITTQTLAKTENKSFQPKIIFFDVNETLLNLNDVNKAVVPALGGQQHLVELWFSTMLHYSLVSTVTGKYNSFGEIGAAALQMVAAHGWDIAGANAAGMKTAFIARPGKALYPLAEAPDYFVKDVIELSTKFK